MRAQVSGCLSGGLGWLPALTVSTSPISIRLFSIVWRVVSKRTPPTLSTMRSGEAAAIFGVLEYDDCGQREARNGRASEASTQASRGWEPNYKY